MLRLTDGGDLAVRQALIVMSSECTRPDVLSVSHHAQLISLYYEISDGFIPSQCVDLLLIHNGRAASRFLYGGLPNSNLIVDHFRISRNQSRYFFIVLGAIPSRRASSWCVSSPRWVKT